jgi:hypothetical protein
VILRWFTHALRRLRPYIALLILLLASGIALPASAQSPVALTVGGVVGYQQFESSDWHRVYGSSKLSYGGFVGIGDGQTFVIGKYRFVNATGELAEDNAPVRGTTEWNENFMIVGLHSYFTGSPFEAEAGYVWMQAAEKITPVSSGIKQPTQTTTMRDNGVDVLVGLSLGRDVRFGFDVEYLYMFRKTTLSGGQQIPNLGGFYYGAAVSIIL